jgi:hypothetical protein
MLQKRLSCTNKPLILPKNWGRERVQFLIERFSFLGFEGQYWMLIAAGVIVAFGFLAWKTRGRN